MALILFLTGFLEFEVRIKSLIYFVEIEAHIDVIEMIKEIGDVIDRVETAIAQAEIEIDTEIIADMKDRIQGHTGDPEVEVANEAVDLRGLGGLDLVIGAGIGM